MFSLYLMSIASNVQTMCAVVGIMLLIGCAVGAIMCHMEDNEVPKYIKRLTFVAGAVLLIAALTPTSQSLFMIYSANKITSSETIKQDAPDLYNLGVKVLKKKLEDELKDN